MLCITIFLQIHIEGINYYKWLFFLTLGLFCSNLTLSILKKKRITIKSIKEYPSQDEYLIFNEIEKKLIALIIESSSHQKHFTVNEMNLHLGVKNKSIEIQKKVRTETIIRINHKFNVNFNMDTVFIERVRSIEDRRYFNYFINEENINTFLNSM
jgi:hypothetical protein